MNFQKFTFSFLFLLQLSFLSKSVNAQLESNAISGEYIVMLHGGKTLNELKRSLSNNQITAELQVLSTLSEDFKIYHLKFPTNLSEINSQKVLFELAQNPIIALAQHNHQVQLRATPNDANFATQQWSLNNTGQGGGTVDADIDATEAWDITTGGATVQGDSIVVAVIDGGFQMNHPDLIANYFRNYAEINGISGVDDDNNGYVDDLYGWNAYNNNGTIPSDQHGTHVSGIIGAVGNNSIGVSGVNWKVKIMPIAGSSGTEATVVAAYSYAAKMRKLYNETNGAKGAFVVSTNSSFGVDLGNPNNYPIWCAFYDTLGVRGILSAGATANANYNVDTQGDIPTACPSNFLITVTNTDRNDAKNNSCGYGLTTIDLGSPGTQIYNTVTNSGYQNLTGTSMSTPHVAGSIGLMYAAACNELIQAYKSNPGAIALQMKNYLLNGTDPVASMNGITVTGGRLNVHKALLNVQSFQCDTTTPPNANFSAPQTSGCPGTTITFNNTTIGNNVSYQWIFPGGSPSSSNLTNPTITYPNIGNYSVTLIATNNYGSDTIVYNNYININNSSITNIFTETFEQGTLSSLGWQVINPDGYNTWDIFTVAGNTPGTKAIGVNIFNNQSYAPAFDEIVSPTIDLTNFSSPVLTFEHAHRRRVQNIADSLIVKASVDGGLTFPFTLLTLGGGGNPSVFATGTLLTSNFVPAAAGDWCFFDNSPGCFSANLSAYQGHSNFKLKFIIKNMGGNNIYIDNIKIDGVCSGGSAAVPPIAQFTANKTSICEKAQVQFTDQSQNSPIAWAWVFDGGTPATSNIPNPIVTYNNPGTYNVSLTVTNAAGNDVSIQNNYITVDAIPATPIITESGGMLQSSSATGNQWYLNGNIIPGATSSTYTPTANGSYTVTVTTATGCSATSDAFNLATSIENFESLAMKIYPNPTNRIVNFEFLNTITAESYRISDMTGRQITSRKITNNPEIVDVSELSAGTYLIEITTKNSKFTQKLIISR